MENFIFVYITNPDKETAKKISKHLLKKRLIACANIHAIESLYWWEGKIVDEPEFVILGKTYSLKYEKIKKEVAKIHPYSVPCIIQIPIQNINDSYKDWLIDKIQEIQE